MKKMRFHASAERLVDGQTVMGFYTLDAGLSGKLTEEHLRHVEEAAIARNKLTAFHIFHFEEIA